MELQEQSVVGSPQSMYEGAPPAAKPLGPALNLGARVAKLLDFYLAEVARDSKLPLAKFQSLAEALPEGSRLCDDGLYRAVDTFLKVCVIPLSGNSGLGSVGYLRVASRGYDVSLCGDLQIHPMLTEHERKRLCRILNWHRLSLNACTHASQNERLPLRFVVQVLFCEQLKIRSTVTEMSNSVKEDHSNAEIVSVASREPTEGAASSQATASTSAGTPQSQALQESVNQLEIRALQRELATMRVKWNDLERDHGNIQDQVLTFSTELFFMTFTLNTP